jgi:hypothetical protein
MWIYIYICVCVRVCVCVWHMTYMFLNSAKSMCMFFGHGSSSHDHRMPKAPHGAVTSRHFARQVLYSKYMAPAEERLQLLENDSQAQEAHLWILGCPCDFAYAWVSVVHCSLQWICGDSIRYMRFLSLPFFIDIFVTHCDTFLVEVSQLISRVLRLMHWAGPRQGEWWGKPWPKQRDTVGQDLVVECGKMLDF